MSPHQWWRATPIAVASTPTALFRDHMPPVFLHPRHWMEGCWTCAAQWPARQQLLEQEQARRERAKAHGRPAVDDSTPVDWEAHREGWPLYRIDKAVVCAAQAGDAKYYIERCQRTDPGRPAGRAWYSIRRNDTPVSSTLSLSAAKRVAQTDNAARKAMTPLAWINTIRERD